jgi:Fur family ferric uptake transcriptional regulator
MDNSDLKEAGLRTTGPRLKVLQLLEKHRDAHLSADEVYHRLRDAGEEIGVATVYRVLSQFESAGIVTRRAFSAERSVYELADEAHHDHLICTRCGQVVEFFDPSLERQQDAVAASHGFHMLYHELNLFGLCAGCQGGGSSPG